MRVLITGASGLIGRHTLVQLRESGYSIRAFQRGPVSGLVDGVDTVTGDIRTDRQLLCEAARGCGAIVHLAGRGDVGESRRDPVGYAELNAMGALNALDAARSADAVFVLASSQRVYRLRATACKEDDQLQPDSPYGYAKWVAELWCRMASEQYGMSVRILRFFSVYGPGQQANGGSGVVSIFARAAVADQPLTIQSDGRRDFTDVRDVARGIQLAIDDAECRGGHRVVNVATGVGTSFRSLAETIVELSGSSSEIRQTITEPAGLDLVADVRSARDGLGFQARIPLRDGIEHYLRWLRNCS